MTMDAFTVQQYVADWLNAAQIPTLGHMWPAKPSAIGMDFNQFGSGDHRCQGIVYVTDDPEIRRSPGAPRNPTDPGHGIKLVTYGVRLEFCMRSADPDWITADHLFKQLIEAVKVMIRKDGALGTGTYAQPLFSSAGEGPRGMRADYLPPFVDEADGQREQWATVDFDVMSWIEA